MPSSWAPGSGEQREWGYVALSRARRATRIYVTEAALKIGEHGPNLDHEDGVNRLARALAHTIDQDHSIGPEFGARARDPLYI